MVTSSSYSMCRKQNTIEKTFKLMMLTYFTMQNWRILIKYKYLGKT